MKFYNDTDDKMVTLSRFDSVIDKMDGVYLSDTLMQGVSYCRYRFSDTIMKTDLNTDSLVTSKADYILYFLTNQKSEIAIFNSSSFTKINKCSVMIMDVKVEDEDVFVRFEISKAQNKLTDTEEKIFEKWENTAKKYPVKKESVQK